MSVERLKLWRLFLSSFLYHFVPFPAFCGMSITRKSHRRRRETRKQERKKERKREEDVLQLCDVHDAVRPPRPLLSSSSLSLGRQAGAVTLWRAGDVSHFSPLIDDARRRTFVRSFFGPRSFGASTYSLGIADSEWPVLGERNASLNYLNELFMPKCFFKD